MNALRRLLCFASMALLAGCMTAPRTPQDLTQLREQVRGTELAFAKTMADRDHSGFASFLSEETVFFSPQATHGKQAVAQAWARFYEGPVAPFSWRPEEVEVLASGQLAISSGPVFNPAGKQIGQFMSVWRLEAPGTWRIIFDKGCNCPAR
jgi:ketosteroid isomerase-like protein